MGPKWKTAKGRVQEPLQGGTLFTYCPWASGRGRSRCATVACWFVTHEPPD